MADASNAATMRKRSLRKLRLCMMLSLILPTLSACASKATGTDVHDWCLSDQWISMSRKDTPETQDEIVRHNAGFKAAGCKAGVPPDK